VAADGATEFPAVSATGLTRWVPLSLLLAAFALRVAGLASQELRGDEAFGYFFSLQPPGEIIARTLALEEPHPVASYLIQHLWLGWAGNHEYALRFPSAWWSTLAVALTISLGRRLALGEGQVAFGALLLALSPYVLWHAQDARMYSMSLALTLATTLCAVAFWRTGRGLAAVGYVGAAVLALHTHYFAAYVLVAQSVVVLALAITARAWRRLGILLALQAIVALIVLPWFLAAAGVLRDYRGNGDSPGLTHALLRALGAFVAGEGIGPDQRVAYAVLVAAGLAAGAWRLVHVRGDGRAAAWWLVGLGLGPVLATWLSAQTRPIFDERYLVAAVAPVYLLIAAGVVWRGRRRLMSEVWMGALVAIMVAGMLRYHTDPAISKNRDWRELAAGLAPLTAGRPPAEVRVVQNYPDPTLWYYYRGSVDHLVLPPGPLDASGAAREVAWMVDAGVGRAILIEQPAPSWDPGGLAADALASSYSRIATASLGRWSAQVYAAPADRLPPVDVAYANGLRLDAAAVIPREALAGSVIEVHLAWNASAATLLGSEHVSVQMLDATGRLMGQQDSPLGLETARQTRIAAYGILVPDALRGDAKITVVVYDAATPELARVRTVDGKDAVTLAVLPWHAP
jgi:hypothetical protein